MRKIGINLDAYPNIPDEEYVARIAELGFETTFCMTRDDEALAKRKELLDQYGITCETLHAPFRKINDMWRSDSRGENSLNELKESVDKCAIVDSHILVVHLSSGANPPTLTEIGRMRFDALIQYAMRKNVCLAFENQRRLDNLAWVMENYRDNPCVAFCWDCGHENCFTPRWEYMPLFGDRLVCTHIHDNMGPTKDEHLIPFDGNNDFARKAELLKKSGFEGSLMLELSRNSSDRYTDLSWEEYSQRAADAAKKLRAMVDGE